jgi:hypothetical protein
MQRMHSASASARHLELNFTTQSQRCVYGADPSRLRSRFIATKSIAMQSEGSQVIALGHLEALTTPADVAERCSNCSCALSAEDLYLKSVAEQISQKRVDQHWEKGAEGGCMFCRLITAVEKDAKQQYKIRWIGHVKVGLTTDGQYFLHLNTARTKLPHTLVSRVYSTINVFLQGKASSVDSYVLIYQHHRFKFTHPPGET